MSRVVAQPYHIGRCTQNVGLSPHCSLIAHLNFINTYYYTHPKFDFLCVKFKNPKYSTSEN